MKLLFDQNISYRLIKKLEKELPLCLHVSKTGLSVPAKDREIWNYALANHYTVITFDEDFVELANLYGAPPKIIWLRLGNVSTAVVAEKIIENLNMIEEFISNNTHDVLEIY